MYDSTYLFYCALSAFHSTKLLIISRYLTTTATSNPTSSLVCITFPSPLPPNLIKHRLPTSFTPSYVPSLTPIRDSLFPQKSLCTSHYLPFQTSPSLQSLFARLNIPPPKHPLPTFYIPFLLSFHQSTTLSLLPHPPQPSTLQTASDIQTSPIIQPSFHHSRSPTSTLSPISASSETLLNT